MSNVVRMGSLCSGIGGLGLGIGRALAASNIAHQTMFHVEIDPLCRLVLVKRPT